MTTWMRLALCAGLISSLVLTKTFAQESSDGDDPVLEELEQAKELATKERYKIVYKFRKGEVLRWRVVHLATTETSIQDKAETSRTRSVATRAWRVLDVDDEGNATIELVIEEVEMWQKVSDRPEVKYNSRTDKTPPPQYAAVAETIGVPLVKVQVTPNGQIIARNRPQESFDLGLGQMTIPFPNNEIAVGSSWYVPRDVIVRLPGGSARRIKIRQKYTLQSVRSGVATIRVQSQTLTPVNHPQIEAQLMQDLIDGTIRFDVDAGRLISRQVDWDDTVVEFAGASSLIKYRARLTEKLLAPVAETARNPAESGSK